MNEINTNLNTEQPTTPTPEASGDQGEKMFTQADVNRIVSERLAREKAKTEPSAIDEREIALKARETAVKAREARLECRAYLKELSKGGKAASSVRGLVDVLDTTDVEQFKKTVTALLELGAFNPQLEHLEPLRIPRVDIRRPPSSEDMIAAAFRKKT